MKLTISNVFGSFNRGDALLVEALHASLRDTFGADADFHGIAHFPELERDHLPDVTWTNPPGRSYSENKTVRRGANAARALAALGYAYSGAPKWPLPGILPPAQRASVRALRDSDLVISCAGGFLLDANVSIYGNLLQMHLAQRFGTPVILAPQTIGPISSPRLRDLTRKVLSRAHLICAREAYTYTFLTEDLQLPADKVVRTTDIAFEHQSVDMDAGAAALAALGLDGDADFVGATVVDWGFHNTDNPEARKALYVDKMVALLSKVHDETGMKVLLLNQVSSDLSLGKRVAERVGPGCIVDTADRSTSEMRGIMARASVFLGSRFHSCVFALLSSVPTTALAYTYKSTGIMEDLGFPDRVFDIDSFEVDRIAAQLKQSVTDRPALSQATQEAIANMRYPKFKTILQEHAPAHLVPK